MRTILNLILFFLFAPIANSSSINFRIHLHDPNSIVSEKDCSFYMKLADSLRIHYQEHLNKLVYKFDIFALDSALYFLPDGTFDVLEYKNQTFSNLYQHANSGYNNQSFRFLYKDRLYSAGGYGFWNLHGQVIFFDMETGEWEIVVGSEDFPFGIFYVHGEELHLLTNVYHYTLNLETQKATRKKNRRKIGILEVSKDPKVSQIHLQEYTVGDWTKLMGGSFLYNPTGTIKTQSVIAPFSKRSVYLHFKKDSLIQYDVTFQKLKAYNIEQELSSLKDNRENSSFFSKSHWFGLLVILFLLGLLFRSIQRKFAQDNLLSMHSESSIKETIQKFHPLKNTHLTSDDLDRILEIDQEIIGETLRSKRSKFIKEINATYQLTHHKDLIKRIKDPNDGRKYLYFING